MVLTKADIQQIKEAVNVDVLTSKMYNLTIMVNNISSEIDSKIVNLEKSLKSSINDLRDELKTVKISNDALIIQVNTENAKFEGLINSIREKNLELEMRGSENTNDRVLDHARLENLQEKIVSLETSVFDNMRHGRRRNLEIDGIPANIGEDGKQLEIAALKIFKSINVDCTPRDIEAIHRLPSKLEPKPTIVLLNNRKIVEELHKNKAKLKNLASLNLEINGLDSNSQIYLRPSLCPYYKRLQYNCWLLRRNQQIKQVRTEDDGVIKIKTLDNVFVKISHEMDLRKKFPQFHHFSFC